MQYNFDYWLNLSPPQQAELAAEGNNIHYMDSYFLLCSTELILIGWLNTL